VPPSHSYHSEGTRPRCQKFRSPCICPEARKGSVRTTPAHPKMLSPANIHCIADNSPRSGRRPSHKASPSVLSLYPPCCPPNQPYPDISASSPQNRCTKGPRPRGSLPYGCLSILYPTPHTTFKYFGFFGSSSIFSLMFLTCTMIVSVLIAFSCHTRS